MRARGGGGLGLGRSHLTRALRELAGEQVHQPLARLPPLDVAHEVEVVRSHVPQPVPAHVVFRHRVSLRRTEEMVRSGFCGPAPPGVRRRCGVDSTEGWGDRGPALRARARG